MSQFSGRLLRSFTFLIWLAIIASFWGYSRSTGMSAFDIVHELIFFAQSSIWGPIIYVLFYFIQPIVFFPSTFLTIAAGYVYGPVLGTALAIVGSNGSSALAWLVGRFFGDALISDRFKQSMLVRFSDRLRTNSFQSVLLMRLVYLPYDVVSYFSGFIRLSFTAFVFGTMLGGLPGTISFGLFGASIEGDFLAETPTINGWNLAGALLLFLVSITISRVVKYMNPAVDAPIIVPKIAAGGSSEPL
ncbi:MAG: VTT domain-containing protein [Chloroflexota bacterium]